MTHRPVAFWAAMLCLAMAAALIGADEPLFTTEQASRGKALYAAHCSACHGTTLKGATAGPLAGPAFAASWGFTEVVGDWAESKFTVDDLYFVIRTTMPPGRAQSLSAEEYTSILTYILQQNGYLSGHTLLKPDSPRLKEIKLRFGVAKENVPPAAPLRLDGEAKSVPKGAGPTQDELTAAYNSTRDWLYHTHDYSGARHVRLDQINTGNVAKLRVACAFQLGEISNFQTGPIVYNGTMYVTTVRATVALDAGTCRPKWRHTWEPKDREVWLNNRGVAIKDGYVVRGTSDGYLVALNAATGDLVWAVKAADTRSGETLTMAPMIYQDMVLIGPAGSENSVSGWVGAFRLADGSSIWKFKTVPGADGGSSQWKNPSKIKLGGGAVWTPFSLDPENGELYIGVTNPAPDFAADLRPDDNLYTNSLVALDVRTGKLRWHKQMIRNDSHDWDLTQVSPLFRAQVNGREARLIATVGKDGVLRAVSRDNRETLYQTPVTTLKNADVPVPKEGILACPGVLGGVEWNGPSYHPGLNMLYVGAVDWCTTFWSSKTVRYIPGKLYMGGLMQLAPESQGWVTAMDASTGQVKWKYRSLRPMVSAVTTTSGNLVFTGELTGDFVALDARSGEVLYRFNTGGAIGGGVITYQHEGKQYVAVLSGRPSPLWIRDMAGAPTVFLFALP